jgi:Ca2+-binding RTX toxin-like protein
MFTTRARLAAVLACVIVGGSVFAGPAMAAPGRAALPTPNPVPLPLPWSLPCSTLWTNVIVGTDGDDNLVGTDENDLILGLGGRDWIDGGRGRDTIVAGEGDDNLVGGPGNDCLIGGDGDDTAWRYTYAANGNDDDHEVEARYTY